MFRLNDYFVIDATMAGGPARYINHSCNPNCYTEVVNTEKGDKIVISADRRINAGEEVWIIYKISLDYFFKEVPNLFTFNRLSVRCLFRDRRLIQERNCDNFRPLGRLAISQVEDFKSDKERSLVGHID